MATGIKETRRRVKSVDTTFRIIETLREMGGAGVTELADQLGLAKSTVHNYLTTLQSNEYLVKQDGKYHLSLRFHDHGMYVKSTTQITNAVEPTLTDLAEELEALVQLTVEEHGCAVYLNRENGDHTVTYGRSGSRRHLHCVAGGKAILAHLPEARIEEIVSNHGLEACTEHTITDRDELNNELQKIREQGVAFNDQESKLGLRAVAAPILKGDRVVGSLSVSEPTHRMTETQFRQLIPEKLRAGTNEIELQLSYDKP